jgi:ribosome-binding ATPase
MKIAFTGVSLPEGKLKYEDPILKELEEKFAPKKVSPYFFEFVKDGYDTSEAIVIAKECILDLLILDMEKIENRLERVEDDVETELLKKCISFMEDEKPLCNMEVSDSEKTILAELAPVSFKPVLVLEKDPEDVNLLIKDTMDKADVMFFYTAGKPEVHAWFVQKGSDIVTCAGKIHSDLARGFIKAEIVNIKDYSDAHNLNDARTKGLANLVDRDYIIQEGDIIDIRFNV